MRRLTRGVVCGARHFLPGASLLEAVVAAVLFLTLFAAVMELVPRLTVRDDDALLVAEAEYRAGRAFEKYATGLWPCGEYAERQDWGDITVQVSSYGGHDGVRCVTVTARIDGSRKQIVLKQLVACVE